MNECTRARSPRLIERSSGERRRCGCGVRARGGDVAHAGLSGSALTLWGGNFASADGPNGLVSNDDLGEHLLRHALEALRQLCAGFGVWVWVWGWGWGLG